jgi:hypothetical protein
MQGLPIQQLQKPAQVSAKGAVGVEPKEGAVVVNGKGEAQTNEAKGAFASLFAKLTGADQTEGKPSQVKSENGETLKNLLEEKKSDKIVEDKVTLLQPAVSKESGKAHSEKAVKAEGTAVKIHGATEDKVAKTNNNLDQLLNSLKGTQDSQNSNEEIDPEMKKQIPVKGEMKSESPLEFLMKGMKSKGVGETEESVQKTSEDAPKKLVSASGEEFLKNKDAAKDTS